jgi:hypothetical protein
VTPASWSLIVTVEATLHWVLTPLLGSSWPITSTIARYLRLCHEMFQIPAARN